MLNKNNTCEDYFVRGCHNNVDYYYYCVKTTSNCRQLIRENANFICLFQKDVKYLDHSLRDHFNDITNEQTDTLCTHYWTKSYGFVTINLTCPKTAGKYHCKFDELY